NFIVESMAARKQHAQKGGKFNKSASSSRATASPSHEELAESPRLADGLGDLETPDSGFSDGDLPPPISMLDNGFAPREDGDGIPSEPPESIAASDGDIDHVIGAIS